MPEYSKIVYTTSIFHRLDLGNGPCLTCVYRVMNARAKFGEHERNVRARHTKAREKLPAAGSIKIYPPKALSTYMFATRA